MEHQSTILTCGYATSYSLSYSSSDDDDSYYLFFFYICFTTTPPFSFSTNLLLILLFSSPPLPPLRTSSAASWLADSAISPGPLSPWTRSRRDCWLQSATSPPNRIASASLRAHVHAHSCKPHSDCLRPCLPACLPHPDQHQASMTRLLMWDLPPKRLNDGGKCEEENVAKKEKHVSSKLHLLHRTALLPFILSFTKNNIVIIIILINNFNFISYTSEGSASYHSPTTPQAVCPE